MRAHAPFDPAPHLNNFAGIARNSAEYQGHGWGCAWLEGDTWQVYHDICPIWEDDLNQFGKTTLFLAHARSAFRDEGVMVENNMPFFDGEQMFIFNGELQGVRIKETGRIGAEKVFNYLKRFNHGSRLESIRRGVAVIKKRSRYIRAMNLLIVNQNASYLVTCYSENPDYFQMYRGLVSEVDVICSQPYPNIGDWQAIDNYTIMRL